MMILGLILSGVVGVLGFGYLVSIMQGDDPLGQWASIWKESKSCHYSRLTS
jgi:hypothetical protein